MIRIPQFDSVELPEGAEALRQEVRTFVREEVGDGTIASWSGSDRSFSQEFSQKLAARGWVGMRIPKEYGGHDRSALERFIVSEELLAAGAPLSFHWVADRQSGPLILHSGTEKQRQEILPKIAAGELCFCIGMSEPDSGSDLASIQTHADRVDGGWHVNGTKLWTSFAHKAHYMIGLVRTTPKGEDRHAGMSQFLIDLSLDGIEIRPIKNLAGREDFCEVVFTDCFVPEDMLIGEEGNGWTQVTSELGHERAGPERFLNTFKLLRELMRAIGPEPTEAQAEAVGRLVAHLVTLRQLSLSVAGMLQAGRSPNIEASMVKDLGTEYEQAMPNIARGLMDGRASRDSREAVERALAESILTVPAFSIQGGTREILRVIIARGIGLQ